MSNVSPISQASQARGAGIARQLTKMLVPNGTYDPDKYYLEAGSSFRSKVQFNLSRNIKDAIGIVCGNNENYRTEADMGRNYFVHGLMRDVDKLRQDGFIEASEEVARLIELDNMMARQEAIKVEHEVRISLFEMYVDNVARMVQDDDVEAMNQMFHEIEDQAYDERNPPGLRKQWGELYDRVAAAIARLDRK